MTPAEKAVAHIEKAFETGEGVELTASEVVALEKILRAAASVSVDASRQRLSLDVPPTLKWIVASETSHERTWVARVEGGWLFRTVKLNPSSIDSATDNNSVALCFVPRSK